MTEPSLTLDPAVLAKMADAVGADVVPDLLRAFVADLAKARRNAIASVARGDALAYEATMHSLLGVCASFGAVQLRAMAGAFTVASGANDLTAAWGVLEPVLAATAAAVRDVVEKPGNA